MKSNFDFETLIDQHSRLLWSISSGILGEYAAKEVIEDILSDVFAELYQFPEHFDEERKSEDLALYEDPQSKSRLSEKILY